MVRSTEKKFPLPASFSKGIAVALDKMSVEK